LALAQIRVRLGDVLLFGEALMVVGSAACDGEEQDRDD